jgi:hypothetical protein
MRKQKAIAISLSFALSVFLGVTSLSFAQGAWVEPKGTGSITVSYQNYFIDRHMFGDKDWAIVNGVRTTDVGELRFQTTFLDLGYSITDNLGLSVTFPFVTAKYTAPIGPPVPGFGPHKLADGSIPVDDGRYHGGAQDFTVRLRYKIAARPVVITPYVQYGFPSTSYQFYSHAVIGNRVSEFVIGSYFGRVLDPILPNFYVNGGYGVGFPQRIVGISRIHHKMEFEGGYFLGERARLFGILIGQVTDGGLDLTQDFSPETLAKPFPFNTRFPEFGEPKYDAGNELFLHHLQISRENYLDVSGGMSYTLTDNVGIYGVVIRTLTARNLHPKKYGVSFGIGWGFGGTPQRPCHC